MGHLPLNRIAQQNDLAFRRRINTGKQVEDRGFSGAVGADQTNDFIVHQADINLFRRGQAAKGDAQGMGFKHWLVIPYVIPGLKRHLGLCLMPSEDALPQHFKPLPQPDHGELPGTKQARRAEEHHHNQQHRVDNQAVLIHAAQQFRQGDQHNRGDDGPCDGPHAAQDHHDQVLNGFVEVKHPGLDDAGLVREQPARDASVKGGHCKSQQLIPCGGDASRFRRDGVFPDGDDSPAMTRAPQGENAGDDERRDGEDEGEGDDAGEQPVIRKRA